ncbi:MAG TPA: aminotransferase class I/II-fold pyridoxal phosphate-dependent enzyme, partial [Steroidobacteraceae bacterium]|nr:aminotransferase class I/II-fold pyridoxal phosphate-dependent enzyme [Steroidobacteraceae bacterium]
MVGKERVEDLAIAGGPPAFRESLHVGRPNIGDRARLLERINDLLDRRWLTNDGRYVRELEAELARRIGVRHCLAVCNATLGLQLAARALDLSGEVIVPAFTFVATAHALQWLGIAPVFADIDPRTHNIDPAHVEALVNERTTGILGVHLWGRACDVRALAAIARRHRLRLLFDAAHAFGCSHDGRSLGSFGDAEVLSFHATKYVNSFEGGAVTTDDDTLAARVRAMRNFGLAGGDRAA